MQKPFFSIIIPTLNEEKYLPHLLTDLSRQTFRDFQVIVVDGGSTDQTITKAKQFSSRLTLTILSSPISHVALQRNLGAKHTRADVLIFSDADNRFSPSFLLGLKYRWETTNVDILSAWLTPDIINNRNNSIALALNLFNELQNNFKPTYLLEALIVLTKQTFIRIGGFDETRNYSEGKSFIQTAANLGYSSFVVRDPTYVTSFRRYRKFGTIKVISHAIKLELAEVLGLKTDNAQKNLLYPMRGGTLYHGAPLSQLARKRFLKKIQQQLEKVLS